MEKIKATFKAGKYYVGDPCYAIKDENWSSLLDCTGCFGLDSGDKVTNWDNGIYEYNGGKCFADGTKYGDGTYYDNKGNVYGVDAGLLGIIPIESCDGNSMDGGNIIEFDEPFYCRCEDGHFYFGKINIETGDEGE